MNVPDHRRLGRELDLYASSPLVGSGLPLWLPDGAVIRSEIEQLVAEESARSGCQRVYSPVLAKRELFERSGHWQKFADDMFPPMLVGGEEYVLRPANCPHHALIYAARPRSFRDLPLRLSELGAMFRSELSGVVSGLSRVRQINLDDCHVFCSPEQVADEVVAGLNSVRRCAVLLGIEISYFRLSAGDGSPKFLGDPKLWRRAEAQLAAALDEVGLAYEVVPGEAAFYGPKVDVQVLDPQGREESLSTVQLDFVQPERFELEYVGSDGRKHRPVMIHRGILSAMERMVAALLERYDGALPPWLSPVQVQVLAVADRHEPAVASLVERLRAAGLRAEARGAEESLGARIRSAWLRRVPYVAVIGDREVAADSVSLRLRDGRQLAQVGVDALVEGIRAGVRSRDIGLGFE